MSVTDDFRALAETIVDELLEADPVAATELGKTSLPTVSGSLIQVSGIFAV